MSGTWTRLSPERNDEIVARWRGRPVAVIGDVMLDRYVWGIVSRISPEAPVPVLEVEEETCRLGGAANVANNIRAVGGRPELLSVRGDDAAGERLVADLAAADLGTDSLIVDPRRPTTQKTRVVARGHHLVRVDRESRRELDGEASDTLCARIEAALARCEAVVISDYGKGLVTPRTLETTLAAARRRRLPVCVDPKETHFLSYRGVAVVTPNQHEAAEVLGFKLRNDELLARAGAELLQRLDAEAVLITRGEHGMSLFERSGRRTDFPAEARRVFDVTGAGDTVVALYAVSLAAGAEPREAAFLANRGAGLVVREVGTAVPHVDRLLSEPPAGES